MIQALDFFCQRNFIFESGMNMHRITSAVATIVIAF